MKLFAFSDPHGFADILQRELTKAGFEPGNPDHLLVGCGDYFDRGHQPFKMMKYLNSIPNKVLCLGNHEQLLVDCIERGYPESHDWHNGTAQTIMDLAMYYIGDVTQSYTFQEACSAIEKPVKEFIGQMVDYYESELYLFVHSWVPLNCTDGLPMYYTRNRKFTVMKNWRSATKQQWQESRWGNPFNMAACGLMPDKNHLVAGHWHCSTGWSKKLDVPEFGDGAIFEPFFDDSGFISIDSCVAYSKKINVLIIEDDLLKE